MSGSPAYKPHDSSGQSCEGSHAAPERRSPPQSKPEVSTSSSTGQSSSYNTNPTSRSEPVLPTYINDEFNARVQLETSPSARSFRVQAAPFRSLFIRRIENPFLPCSWWLGQINVSQAAKYLDFSSSVARISEGYGIGLAVILPGGVALRSEVLLLFWRKRLEPTLSFSLTHSLSFPRVISWDMRSAQVAMCGDVDAMKIEFGNQEATPFDILPDGSTLLHVSSWKIFCNLFSLMLRSSSPPCKAISR